MVSYAGEVEVKLVRQLDEAHRRSSRLACRLRKPACLGGEDASPKERDTQLRLLAVISSISARRVDAYILRIWCQVADFFMIPMITDNYFLQHNLLGNVLQ